MLDFDDRADAGRRLAERLGGLRGRDAVVLGLPRGGVPVAFEVARALGAPLDVIVVRKLGVPFQPELAMGAIGEGGVLVVNDEIVRRTGLGETDLTDAQRREQSELDVRVERFRRGRPRVELGGRTVVVVDDGVATGATARAACQVVRAQGARRVILAVPVGSPDIIAGLRRTADDVVCVLEPDLFHAVGQWYREFGQTSDGEVVELLDRATTPPTNARHDSDPADPAGPARSAGTANPADAAHPGGAANPGGAAKPGGIVDPGGSAHPAGATNPSGASGPGADADGPPVVDEEVWIDGGFVELTGHLTVPARASGVVAFAHGSGSSRHSPRNRLVAAGLNQAGLGTLLFDLLTTGEELDRGKVFDIGMLADRLVAATAWLRDRPDIAGARIGYFGASTGAAAALCAAAEPGADIAAVVSRGGRPDLAERRLSDVRAPTLLIVGGADRQVIGLNQRAQRRMRCQNQLTIVPAATHLFEEPGALRAVTDHARDWFLAHMR
ncbi:phosphoribosyltransferase family protein [Actinomadura citrea]|uniref:phosphoribosyltransferase family protein n=1 Tax=Actinomadura citrea TaxID=46158 RepID=UPI002E28B270|nr:phosphoribosyltransferase family protein [Actinomadura citrea]